MPRGTGHGIEIRCSHPSRLKLFRNPTAELANAGVKQRSWGNAILIGMQRNGAIEITPMKATCPPLTNGNFYHSTSRLADNGAALRPTAGVARQPAISSIRSSRVTSICESSACTWRSRYICPSCCFAFSGLLSYGPIGSLMLATPSRQRRCKHGQR